MENLIDSPQTSKLTPWKVLIVDDDVGIHDVTKLVLHGFELDGRGIQFFSAFSGAEAKRILLQQNEIALVFLDVVMESDDSGLELARWMRQTQQNRFTRIVLRTGQPGQAPEERVIAEYDINDYKEKTDIDRTKLFTMTFAALRAYRDIAKVEQERRFQVAYRAGLETVIKGAFALYQKRNMRDFADGLLQQLVALLRLEQSILLRLNGVNPKTIDNSYDVIARAGDFDENYQLFTTTMLKQLDMVIATGVSQTFGETYVGIFPNGSENPSLLVLMGVHKLNELDRKLLEVFSNGVASVFEHFRQQGEQ